MSIRIEIRTIAHEEQRYPTWADWEWLDMGSLLRISISRVSDPRYVYLAAIHELLEAIVCQHEQVTQTAVDAFDSDYENRRIAGQNYAACGCRITDDPGSDDHAPYRLAHKYAESVEYGLARLLSVDAKEYDAAFIALDGGVAGNKCDHMWEQIGPARLLPYRAHRQRCFKCGQVEEVRDE